jgi:protoporphyrin/coproporphyrin ferrochelatase
MKQAVLLLAHGAPDRLEDVAEYLTLVRGGRPLAPQLAEEIKQRYAAIGGGSPLTARTREQAASLEAQLVAEGLHVYVGMRNWRPFIREAVAQMQRAGVERIVALCLAPQYSKLSIGLYFRRVQEAKTELGYSAEISWTKSYHDHPLLIEAFHQKLAPLLPCERVLFTAHSLPEKILESADAYVAETRNTASAAAARAGLTAWDFAFQSQGLTDERWLGPTVESAIERYAQEGVREMVLAPIGFVSDHVEILYDVDILFRQLAQNRGIELRRPESLNDSPAFIAALADVVRERLKAA